MNKLLEYVLWNGMFFVLGLIPLVILVFFISGVITSGFASIVTIAGLFVVGICSHFGARKIVNNKQDTNVTE